MVIITDANGNIQSPTIPDNVYQGSNQANEIVFLAPLPQSNVVTITFKLPNGDKIEEQPMTPYTSVPNSNNLSAWRFVLNDVVTQYYGQVTFQIYIYGASGNIWYLSAEPNVSTIFSKTISFKSNNQNFSSISADGTNLYYGATKVYDGTTKWEDFAYKRISFNETPSDAFLTWLEANGYEEQAPIVTTVSGTFPVLRGVPRIPHSLPSQASWDQICTWVATINALVKELQDQSEDGRLESKAILPYDSDFTYSEGATIFDEATNANYTSLQPGNQGHSLVETDWWKKTSIGIDLINSKIQEHNESETAHLDIRELITSLSNAVADIEDLIPEEASENNKLADKEYVKQNYVPITFASRLYFNKTGENTASLDNTAPEPDNSNTLVVTSTNISFDWDNPTIVLTRTLESEIQLNDTNSFALDLYFDLSRNTEITFGAKIKVSTDNGITWTYISSNQSFGEKTYNSGFNSEDIVVYTDLATNETYPVGTLIAIELFKKQEHNSSLTTTYYCGVEIDGANIYSFAEFNFANTKINTNQIEDGAVTYDKLAQPVKDLINASELPSHTGADVNKVLTVDSNNDVVWEYPTDEVVTFTKTNSGGTFTIDSADWVKAMNNDKAILVVTDGANYYVLIKAKYDALTVYFECDTKLAKFIKNGNTYTGTFEDIYSVFTNTAVSSWASDSTYADFGYKATITLSGAKADMIPQVVFGGSEASSGNYLPVAESFDGGIYIWAKVNDAITIPTIILQKAGA